MKLDFSKVTRKDIVSLSKGGWKFSVKDGVLTLKDNRNYTLILYPSGYVSAFGLKSLTKKRWARLYGYISKWVV